MRCISRIEQANRRQLISRTWTTGTLFFHSYSFSISLSVSLLCCFLSDRLFFCAIRKHWIWSNWIICHRFGIAFYFVCRLYLSRCVCNHFTWTLNAWRSGCDRSSILCTSNPFLPGIQIFFCLLHALPSSVCHSGYCSRCMSRNCASEIKTIISEPVGTKTSDDWRSYSRFIAYRCRCFNRFSSLLNLKWR